MILNSPYLCSFNTIFLSKLYKCRFSGEYSKTKSVKLEPTANGVSLSVKNTSYGRAKDSVLAIPFLRIVSEHKNSLDWFITA